MTYTDQEILNALVEIIVEALRVPADSVRPESRLFVDLGAESLDILDIRFRIESSFGFQIDQDEIGRSIAERGVSPEDIADGFTVGAMVEFVSTKLAGNAEPEATPGSEEA